MFVPLELADPKQIRVSFKSFIKSCLPADPPPTVSSSQQLQDTISNYRKEVQESLWMDQVETSDIDCLIQPFLPRNGVNDFCTECGLNSINGLPIKLHGHLYLFLEEKFKPQPAL